MPTIADLTKFLDTFAPPALAGEWDNVGLLLGDRATPVERVMTCLTVTPESAAEACEERAQLVVTHHPILFRAAKRLTSDTSEGRMLLPLARAGVAVYSPHTAFDNTTGGINDLLAGLLGVRAEPLRRGSDAKSCKLVAFVPASDLSRVSDALFAAGAGHIGQYRECSFRSVGTGTFLGEEAANPTVGQKGRREEVEEFRLEVLCPLARIDGIVAALRAAHSYEEPAFDVYPLRGVAKHGEGRVGSLPNSTTLGELAAVLRQRLACGPVQIVGDPARTIQRVAIVCGAGGSFLDDAIRARADVLLTGEARFHDYLAAHAAGIALLLPGHYATERRGIEHLAELLQKSWPELHVWASRRECDPVAWV